MFFVLALSDDTILCSNVECVWKTRLIIVITLDMSYNIRHLVTIVHVQKCVYVSGANSKIFQKEPMPLPETTRT